MSDDPESPAREGPVKTGQLNLSVGAVITGPRFAALFSEAEIEAARRRLGQFGYSDS